MDNKTKNKFIFVLTGFISTAICYISLYGGANRDKKFFIGLAAGIPLAFIAYISFKKYKFAISIEELMARWGEKVDRKRDFKLISRLFYKASGEKIEKDKFYIDDQTWEDLTMDEIYSITDRTISTPGEEMLYYTLRTPYIKEENLQKRRRLIKRLQEDSNLRGQIQGYLGRLGRQRGNMTVPLLWGEDLPKKPAYAFIFTILGLAGYIAPFSMIFLGLKAFVMVILPVFMINSFITYKLKEKITVDIFSIRYLAKLIGCSYEVGKELMDTEYKDYGEFFKSAYNDCRKIIKRGGKLLTDTGAADPLLQYGYILFMVEVRSFFSVVEDIEKYRETLKEMYMKLGEIDAILSIASYRDGIDYYCEPELTNEGAFVKVEDGINPLVENCVPNSIYLNKDGILITGANMSGKSTFLRTLGVNMLLAQSIYTCPAASYSGSFMRIMTSISRSDNIIGGKSYYLAEAEALLKIIKSSGEEVPLFCMIDEIFRGTNSVERIAASAEILKYLVKNNAIAIVATHDIELVDLIGNEYKHYYFTENVTEESLDFDYKIREGVSLNRNAIKIMNYLGYPDEIIQKTNERIQDIAE